MDEDFWCENWIIRKYVPTKNYNTIIEFSKGKRLSYSQKNI
jgi:hypothetical protein